MNRCHASLVITGQRVCFRRLPGFCLVFLLLASLAGCQLPGSQPPAPPQATLTSFVQTVDSQPVITLVPSPTPELIGQALRPTDTPEATPTHPPADTPVSSPTLAPVSPSPVPTLTPTSKPEISAEPTWQFVNQDDFEATQGWYTFTGTRFSFEYREGAYFITNNIPGGVVSSTRTQNYDDVHLEVDAAQVSGPHNGYFGLLCRAQDDSSYYAFVIGTDGFAGIARMIGGNIYFLTPYPRDPYTYNPQVNRIGARCSGSTLTLFVNGSKLLETTDATFTSGHIGLVVGTRIMADITARFDNFIVSQP